MATNNSLNQASEIMVVGPVGTAADGGTLLTVRKDQSATTAIGILNETDNASSQVFLNLKQELHNGGTPYLSTAGVGVYNDQAASNVYAGYFVVQNETGAATTGTKGLVLWDAKSTGTVKVGIGVPASAVDQAIWTSTGGQYRGNNTNVVSPAGYIGEVISNSATGVTQTNNSFVNITSITLTAGNWLIFGHARWDTSGTVSGNVNLDCLISGTSASGTALSGHTYGMDYWVSTSPPISGVDGITGSLGPQNVSISTNTTYYLNSRGNASTFTNVTVAGTITAIRVG